MSIKVPSGRFFGDKFKSEAAGRLLLTEYRYPTAFVIKKHWHEAPYVAFVLRGAYTEFHSTACRDCRAGSLLIQPAGEVHWEKHGPTPVRIFSVQYTPQFLNGMDGSVPPPVAPAALHAPELGYLARQLHREFLDGDPLAALAAEAFALECLVSLRRQDRHREFKGNQSPRWLISVKEMLQDEPSRVPSVATIGREVGVHPVHISRAFRRYFGCTIGEYVRRLRVQRAQQLLGDSRVSLSEIAALVGYSDQSHFSVAFKRLTGTSPGAYRRLSAH
jgi:AraC family transcriptional regulator